MSKQQKSTPIDRLIDLIGSLQTRIGTLEEQLKETDIQKLIQITHSLEKRIKELEQLTKTIDRDLSFIPSFDYIDSVRKDLSARLEKLEESYNTFDI